MTVDDQLDTPIKIIRCDERACALYEDQHLGLVTDHDQLVQGVE